MNWKDATLRELLETPIFEPPFMWLKVGVVLGVMAVFCLIMLLLHKWERS